jgi:glycosyltransferase involved in cell wall biosynthesis
VLHIGNIANNAYNNARIQRQYGVEADVCCYDYYHVMATPEWEDGDLTTKVNPDLPNWWESNLGGFRRPDWYVQGPLALCIEYLGSYRRGERLRLAATRARIQEAYLRMLRIDSGFRPRPPKLAKFVKQHPTPVRISLASAADHLFDLWILGMIALNKWVRSARELPRLIITEWRNVVLGPMLAAAAADPPLIRGGVGLVVLYQNARRLAGLPPVEAEAIRARRLGSVHFTWSTALVRTVSSAVKLTGAVIQWLAAAPGILLDHWFLTSVSPEHTRGRAARAASFVADIIEGDPNPASSDSAVRAALTNFVTHTALPFAAILPHYDIIQGYATDGLIPLANSIRTFACYEHGTLRDLPFEASTMGVTTSVSYRHSPAVFVTNSDVLPSVQRLGLNPSKVHYLPHAFDDEKLRRWQAARPELMPPRDRIVFFSPSRHHWREGAPSWRKGNDVIIRALERVREHDRNFKMVFVEWGREVNDSRALIRELGLEANVEWVPTMGKQELWQRYCTAHAVLDQFVMPALGGVGFEAMTLGSRLVTRLDVATLALFFGRAPDAFQASTPQEVADALIRVIEDPLDREGMGERAREWISKYHSAGRIVALQAAVYEELLRTATLPRTEGRAS